MKQMYPFDYQMPRRRERLVDLATLRKKTAKSDALPAPDEPTASSVAADRSSIPTPGDGGRHEERRWEASVA